MERERDFERQKAFFDIEQRRADHRAGLITSMILNVNRGKESDRVWSAEDFFPHLKAVAAQGDEAEADTMDTKASVEYLRHGFGLFVPTAYRQAVGLPD